MNKLFIFNKIVLVTLFLLTFSLLTNCAKSSKIKAIAANQSNATDKKPMNMPTANTDNQDKILPADLSKIPTLTYCDLIKNAGAYDKKIVRVRAIYLNEFEKTYLYDEHCQIGITPTAPQEIPAETWAEWDKSFDTKTDSEEAKMNRKINGFGRKDIIAVGRFYSTDESSDADTPNRFGHLNCCRYKFSIMRVENVVNPDGKTAKTLNAYGATVKFALSKELEFADFTLDYEGDLGARSVAPHAPKEQLPKHSFRISGAGKTLVVWADDAKNNMPLEFEFGGAKYQIESGISDRSGKLAEDELIVRKIS